MCVASYGVMPQTYIRASPDSGPTGSRPPLAVSWTRTGALPSPGTVVRAGELQARMRATLQRGPRDRRPAVLRDGKRPGGQHGIRTGHHLGGLGRGEKAAEHLGGDGPGPLQQDHLVVTQSGTGPAPQHGAQLGLDVEAQTVVAAEHLPTAGQQVDPLAVGVVGHRVEQRQPTQPRIVPVHQGDLAAVCIDRVDDPEPALRDPTDRGEVDQVVEVLVHLHPGLQRPDALCGLDQPGGGDDVEAGRSRQGVRGDLAGRQRAVREVPQRPLPRDRLPHAPHRRPPGQVGLGQVGRVGRRPDPAEHPQLDLRPLERRCAEGRVHQTAPVSVPGHCTIGEPPWHTVSEPQRPTTDVQGRRTAGATSRQRIDVAVGAGTDMALGVHRLSAERAHRPTGGDDGPGAGNELPGVRGGQADDADRALLELGAVDLAEPGDGVLDVVGEQFQHHLVVAAVPGQTHRPDPEVLGDRGVQWSGVEGTGRRRRDGDPAEGPGGDLVEQVGDLAGEHLDLLLLADE
ncbi:hypothetical protein SDC9_94947 [bioreactor metagenome]|uniref:Uncharacterized protein n=1 Tax=bioreactor metagenome TaxID=1076179 RepID=A0A645ABJ8_9ZZZZ